ncbi:MAG: futalosine hydrolase [Bacteroidota bacterium]
MEKRILIISATAKELDTFLNQYRQGKSWKGYEIDLLVTGVGLTATSSNLTRQIHLKRPGLIIQAGTGGCFDRAVPLGSVVAVKQDRIADEGAIEAKQLKTVFDLGLRGRNTFPYAGGWLMNRSTEMSKIKLKKVKAISVNCISSSKEMIRLHRDRYHPVLESMEGAALHYVCLMERVPFIQIRAISNYIGERNKNKWKLKEAIINLNNELISLLNKL